MFLDVSALVRNYKRCPKMSATTPNAAPTFTIEVGTPGTFTNDQSINISNKVNAEIAKAPSGDQIVIDFNPGDYGESSSIKLPSNTTVKGDGATLQYLDNGSNTNNMFGLMTNEDSTFYNGTLTVNNAGGPPTIINYGTTTDSMSGDSATAIVDKNISVSGLTFESTNKDVFGTWFINAANIDVQDNTYIGGQDGNAFVNVENGVVADNNAVGQINASYDDWNGPNNVVIEGNSSFLSQQASGSNGRWNILMNSDPSGDTNNPGNAMNDGIISNNVAGVGSDSAAIYAAALTSYGLTSETAVTEQGNIDTNLNVVNAGGYVSGGPMTGLTIEDNLFTGAVTQPTEELTPIYVSADGTLYPSIDTKVDGNLIFGAYSSNGNSMIFNQGGNPASYDNAVLGANSTQASSVDTNAQEGTASSGGNLSGAGGEAGGATTAIDLLVVAAPTLFMSTDTATSVEGLDVLSQTTDALSVTISSDFGTISCATSLANATFVTSGGAIDLIINDSPAMIQDDLSQLSYTSNLAGWDDAIEVYAQDSNGHSAIRYMSVLNDSQASQVSNLVTITPGEFGSSGQVSLPAPAGAPAAVTLSADTVMASSGNNQIQMGTLFSMAMLGAGETTVEGGSGPEYITAGAGTSVFNLDQNGAVTVVGGTGSFYANASDGDNLIESGSANATVVAGGGVNSIIGGLGDLDVLGGNGTLNVTTLPQSGGILAVSVDTGAATINALSNYDLIGQWGGAMNVVAGGFGGLIQTFNTSDTASISVSGSNTEVLVGGGSDTVTAVAGDSGLNMFFDHSGATLDFINSSTSSATLSGAAPGATAGSATVFGGAGGGVYVGGPVGSNLLIGGSGLVTLVGSGANNLLSVNGAGSGGNGNVLSVAYAVGGSTMSASSSTTNNNFYGSASGQVDILSAGSGVQNFFIGSGDQETISGSRALSATNNYYMSEDPNAPSVQQITITNFDPAADQLFLNKMGAYVGGLTIQSMNSGAGGSLLGLSDGTTVRMLGVSTASLASMGIGLGQSTV